MDNLSLKFAEAAALQAVDNCADLEALKRLTRQLVQGHYQARAYIAALMEQGLQDLNDKRCGSCPLETTSTPNPVPT
jgi:hypothetical protein